MQLILFLIEKINKFVWMETIIKLELEYFFPLLFAQKNYHSFNYPKILPNASKQTITHPSPLYLFNGYLPFYLHMQSTPKHTPSR